MIIVTLTIMVVCSNIMCCSSVYNYVEVIDVYIVSFTLTWKIALLNVLSFN